MNHRESPIEPTVGRIVYVRGEFILPLDPDRELPAIISRVWTRNCVDLEIFGTIGVRIVTSIQFDSNLTDIQAGAAWRWMDHQVQMAEREQARTGQGVMGSGIRINAPPVVPTSLTDRVTAESIELGAKLAKLSAYLMTADFFALDPEHKKLLLEQHTHMSGYKDILGKRAVLLEAAGL